MLGLKINNILDIRIKSIKKFILIRGSDIMTIIYVFGVNKSIIIV